MLDLRVRCVFRKLNALTPFSALPQTPALKSQPREDLSVTQLTRLVAESRIRAAIGAARSAIPQKASVAMPITEDRC